MNKKELLALIDTLTIDRDEFWVLSSGALTIREIYPSANDLDIAVTCKGLKQLKEHYSLIKKENGWYTVNDKIECVCDSEKKALNFQPEWINNVQIQNIEEYLNYLRGSTRIKDKDRIHLVESYIKTLKNEKSSQK